MDELKEIEKQLNKLKLGTEIELVRWIKIDNLYSEYNNDGEAVRPLPIPIKTHL